MGARNLRGSERGLPHQPAKSSIQKGGPSLTGQPRTTAQGVVASLALPAARTAPDQPVSPLPLADLHQLPRDASLLYDIGRVDDSGRVASNDIINALHWQPGSKLDVILTPRTIVIRAAPGGLFSVPRRPRIIIPSHVRRAHDIKLGDHVPDRRGTGLRPRDRVPALGPGRDDLRLSLGAS